MNASGVDANMAIDFGWGIRHEGPLGTTCMIWLIKKETFDIFVVGGFEM